MKFQEFSGLFESSGFRQFLLALSLDVYVSELLSIYEKSFVDAEGKIVMNVNDHSLLVDEGFFASLFQLPSDGISSFSGISSDDMEKMQLKFFVSKTPSNCQLPRRRLSWNISCWQMLWLNL